MIVVKSRPPLNEYTLSSLTGGWATFDAPSDSGYERYSRARWEVRIERWVEMGRPTTLLISVEWPVTGRMGR